jgi:uncharacterized protein YndB with AHSA1/START domain
MSDVVRVSRTLDASPAEIFAAWTDADQLRQWLCPEPGHVGEASCTPIVGGGFRLVMLFPHGATEVTGEYLAVDPPHRLVFTWLPNGDPARETRVSVTLRPLGATTEMIITHERAADGRYREALTTGWVSVSRRLDRLIAQSGQRR